MPCHIVKMRILFIGASIGCISSVIGAFLITLLIWDFWTTFGLALLTMGHLEKLLLEQTSSHSLLFIRVSLTNLLHY